MRKIVNSYSKIMKMDADNQIVYGVVYEPHVLDTDGEFMLPEDIEKMAHRFMQLDLSKSIDTNHDNIPNGSYPIESFIAVKDDPLYPVGAWVLGVKVSDATWKDVKGGLINGFSFEAYVKTEKMDIKYKVQRDHVGKTAESNDHEHTFFIEVDNMGKVKGGHTDIVNGHSHKIGCGTATLFADDGDEHTHRYFL